MNIGISTSVIGRGRTGIAQYLFGLVRALIEVDTENRYSLFVLEEDVPHFAFAAGRVAVITVPEQFRLPANDIFWHQTKLVRLVRQLEIDVLHIPSYRRLLWAEPCPRVATIHDLAACVLEKKYDLRRTIYGRIVARELARRQNAIIAISNTTAWDIKSYFQIPIERLDVIYNGLDHSRFYPSCSGEKTGEPFFLYVARLEHPGKNHVRLIDGFNRFKFETGSAWKLFMAGANWQGSEAIHQAAACSPFAKDVHYLGFVENEDLPNLYRQASAFVYPSLYEGFGLPPLEAMACGCPVLASPKGGLSEVVGKAARLVDPEDVNSIAAGLRAVAEDAGLRERLRDAGLKRAAEFDWTKTAAATLRVYERACGVVNAGAN